MWIGHRGNQSAMPRPNGEPRASDARPRALNPRLFRQIGFGETSLGERIVADIRHLITTGQITPGDRLPPERELAEAFHVSRASLREALRRLAVVGLVEIRWGQGVYIRSADMDIIMEHLTPLMLQDGNVADLYDIRRLLEVEGAGWAAERASAEERAQLQMLTDELMANRDRLVADAEFARQCDQQYHNWIAAISRNRVLVRIMGSLLDLLGELRTRSFAIPGRALGSLEEHCTITDAIVRGDAAAARQRMREHLRQAEAAVRGISPPTSGAP
jgi:GntR family transcriptional regulator, transcriptional repressor for pyruvate dehydrogenase complex